MSGRSGATDEATLAGAARGRRGAPPGVPAPRMLVAGRLVEAADGATYPILDPATGREIGRAPDAAADDVDAAMAAARAAFDETGWSTDVDLRVRCLRQLRDALVEQGDRMRALLTAEAGAPVFTHGPQHDVPVEGLRWVADLAAGYPWERDLGRTEPMGVPTRRTLRREPAGVVAAITPWNFPTQINLAKVGPALAAGCTVVLKPAPDTPWVACELARLAAERTDLPPGVLNVVTPRAADRAAALVTDPRVDAVSFTGSTATGRAVMAAAAPTLKRVFLELGGKSAAVVLDDADLAAAVSTAAFSVCIHAGQGCALTTRLLVPRERYDEAVGLAAETMTTIGVGDPLEPSTVCGPVVSAAQRDRVLRHLATVEAEGGWFATGGGAAEMDGELTGGFWMQPTVVAGLTNHATVAREEVFGPVLVVVPHDGDDDAVRLADDSPYGLSGSVDSADPERARAVARRIRTGTMSVNGGVWFAPDAPFGGYKQSGVGREMGVQGFEEYLETKLIAERA